MRKSTIIGRYNHQGYEVVVLDEGKETELYQAGNNPLDSAVSQSIPNGVSLKTMKKYCIGTAKEIAKERDAKYGGVEKLELDN